jgi:hypothetical protein
VHQIGEGWGQDYGAAGLVEGEAAGVGYSLFHFNQFDFSRIRKIKGGELITSV